jgi:hypothetical protein
LLAGTVVEVDAQVRPAGPRQRPRRWRHAGGYRGATCAGCKRTKRGGAPLIRATRCKARSPPLRSAHRPMQPWRRRPCPAGERCKHPCVLRLSFDGLERALLYAAARHTIRRQKSYRLMRAAHRYRSWPGTSEPLAERPQSAGFVVDATADAIGRADPNRFTFANHVLRSRCAGREYDGTSPRSTRFSVDRKFVGMPNTTFAWCNL